MRVSSRTWNSSAVVWARTIHRYSRVQAACSKLKSVHAAAAALVDTRNPGRICRSSYWLRAVISNLGKAISWLRIGDEWWQRKMSCWWPQGSQTRYRASAGCQISNMAPPCCSHRLDSARNRTGAPCLSRSSARPSTRRGRNTYISLKDLGQSRESTRFPGVQPIWLTSTMNGAKYSEPQAKKIVLS